ncbi:hypothetical protein ACJMK2_034817, partial [Sinanodonta woodiana]
FAWTQEKLIRETVRRGKHSYREISAAESDIGMFLFQLMDEQITKDNKVTLREYFSLWSGADSNKDKYLSTQEVTMFLEDHLLEASSNAERLFGETDLTSALSVLIRFKYFDTN